MEFLFIDLIILLVLNKYCLLFVETKIRTKFKSVDIT